MAASAPGGYSPAAVLAEPDALLPKQATQRSHRDAQLAKRCPQFRFLDGGFRLHPRLLGLPRFGQRVLAGGVPAALLEQVDGHRRPPSAFLPLRPSPLIRSGRPLSIPATPAVTQRTIPAATKASILAFSSFDAAL